MATVRAFLKSRVAQPGDPAEIISDVNRLVTHDTGDTGQFMTLFYATIDAGKKKLRWVRAGHDPAVLYDPVKDSFTELGGRGMALGVNARYVYREGGITDLSSGQVLLIGTDGLWETHDEAGAMFGKDRLEALIRESAQASADRILGSIIQGVQKFRGSAKQEDDITLAVIKVVGSP
jgi:sigma-B regulation protein RsbU (phosphoserine phosphatase)